MERGKRMKIKDGRRRSDAEEERKRMRIVKGLGENVWEPYIVLE